VARGRHLVGGVADRRERADQFAVLVERRRGDRDRHPLTADGDGPPPVPDFAARLDDLRRGVEAVFGPVDERRRGLFECLGLGRLEEPHRVGVQRRDLVAGVDDQRRVRERVDARPLENASRTVGGSHLLAAPHRRRVGLLGALRTRAVRGGPGVGRHAAVGHEIGVRDDVVFGLVQADLLALAVDTEPQGSLEDVEDGDGRGHRPEPDNGHADDLHEELLDTQERPRAGPGDADEGQQDDPEGAGPAVDGEDATDVVDAQALDRPPERGVDERPADGADEEPAPPGDVGGRARDRDEAGEQPVGGKERVGPPLPEDGHERGGHRAGTHPERRHDEHTAKRWPHELALGREDGRLRADVESEPPEGEKERPDDGKQHRVPGERVAGAVLVVPVPSRPHEVGGGQAGDPADHVDDRPAGEIQVAGADQLAQEAPLREESTLPGQPDDDRVDDAGQQHRVDDVGLEPDAPGDGPGDDGRGGHREHRAEKPADPLAGGVDVAETARERDRSRRGEVAHEVGDAQPHDEEHEHPETPVEEVLHRDVGDVLRPHLPGFQQHEPRLHEEDEETHRQHPDRVDARGQVARVDCERERVHHRFAPRWDAALCRTGRRSVSPRFTMNDTFENSPY